MNESKKIEVEILGVYCSKNEFGGEDQVLRVKFPDGSIKNVKRITRDGEYEDEFIIV